MSFEDGRLCPVCSRLNLQKAFDPARFDGLPATRTLDSVNVPWDRYIQYVGEWRPLTREERTTHYPPGIIPSCPFCEVALGVGHRISWLSGPMQKEKERVVLAIPSNLLFDFATIEGQSQPVSVFLLVMSRRQYFEMSAQYGNETGSSGLTPWVRFAHRGGTGSLVSMVPNSLSASLSDVPMQGQYVHEDKIDYDRLRSWIDICQNHHTNCSNNREWRPVPRLKLIDCETRRIVNTDPSKKYQYVALSYVWGTAPPEKYTYPNLPDDLPPVILDTMRVVKKLGFRYVWIDRYCIWQADRVHKMSQVEKMDQIYSDAELAIIAVGAKDPSYGLPGLTLSRTQHYQIKKRIGQERLAANFSHHWQLEQIARSKWSTRGWTFQETCLSRRRLYFSNYEVSFECHDMMCFEHLTRPLAFHGSLEQHERPEWNHINTPHGVWTVVKNYRARQLTFSSDRLAAISGVLTKWARINPGCFSFWAIPIVTAGWPKAEVGSSLKRAFLAALEWDVWSGSSQSTRLPGFPSWSWISQDGKTIFGGKRESFYLRSPDLAATTKHFDAEVWVEKMDGEFVDWDTFCSTGGLQSPFSQWTRYLHIECWAFQAGPFQCRKLKNSLGREDNILCIPVPSEGIGEKASLVLVLSPDDLGNKGSFEGRTLTAISFGPLERSGFAVVLDEIPGLTVRVGLLSLRTIEDRGTFDLEKNVTEEAHDLSAVFPFAKRLRVRLG